MQHTIISVALMPAAWWHECVSALYTWRTEALQCVGPPYTGLYQLSKYSVTLKGNSGQQ